MAASRGWSRLKPHSASSRTVPTAKARGTTCAGERRERAAGKPRTGRAKAPPRGRNTGARQGPGRGGRARAGRPALPHAGVARARGLPPPRAPHPGARPPAAPSPSTNPRFGYTNSSLDFASLALPFEVAHRPVTLQLGWQRLYQLAGTLA